MNKKIDAKKIALTGVLMALVILSILFIKVPTSFGYIHIADSFILVASVVGPFSAFIVGGLGALVSDLLVGYPMYAPWSLIIHGFQGVIMALIFKKMGKMNYLTFFIVGLITTVIFVTFGYAIAEYAISGTLAAAIASIPLNLLQSVIGAGIGTALYGVYKTFIEKKEDQEN